MESQQTAQDRSGQKETLIFARAEIDHVTRALKGLHLTHWMPHAYPDGDRSSGKCAIDVQFPPHTEETREGSTRRIRTARGTLLVRPAGDGAANWVWGESIHGIALGRPPRE